MRDKFLSIGLVLVVITWIVAVLLGTYFWIALLVSIIYGIGVYNSFQTKHAILRNFPVLGYFRYFFENISRTQLIAELERAIPAIQATGPEKLQIRNAIEGLLHR